MEKKRMRELVEGDCLLLPGYAGGAAVSGVYSPPRQIGYDVNVVVGVSEYSVYLFNTVTRVSFAWDYNADMGNDYNVLTPRVAELVSRLV